MLRLVVFSHSTPISATLQHRRSLQWSLRVWDKIGACCEAPLNTYLMHFTNHGVRETGTACLAGFYHDDRPRHEPGAVTTRAVVRSRHAGYASQDELTPRARPGTHIMPPRTAPKVRPDDAKLGRCGPLGCQKSLKPHNTLYMLPSEPAPDRKHM